jgi:5-methylthioadenosine/S-adenosylhomocysteine deaminase
MRFDLGLRAGRLLALRAGSGEVLRDMFVGVTGKRIESVEPFQEDHRKRCGEFLDLHDQIVMPGLVNGHTHLPMSLFRGFEDDLPFQEWLFQRIFPAEARLVDEDFVRTGVELSALECIRFGTTTVNDMYFHAGTTAEVLDRVGLRGLIAWPFMDFLLPDEKALGLDAIPTRPERFRALFRKYENHPRIRIALGPHAPYTCSDELLQLVGELSRETGARIHMHLCETEQEIRDSIFNYQKSPVERLKHLGVLSPRFIGAHGVHLEPEDQKLLRESGASLIYNPDSNLKLGSGVAAIPDYRELGIPVGLGTDGAASNNDLSMFGAMDIGTKLQKLVRQDNTAMVALDALRMATLDGARALGLDREIGSIEVGKRADIISIRTDHAHLQPLHSVLSQLVYSCQGLEVDHVFCDGRQLLRGGAVVEETTGLDMEAIYRRADQIRERLQSEIKNNPSS